MNAVEVCNLALGYIGHGASAPVESLTAPDEASRACNRIFLPTLRLLLREFAWGFAQKSVALATPEGVEVPGWGYVYTYPKDCLFLHGIGDGEVDPWSPSAQVSRVPYAVLAHPTAAGRIIATDHESAVAHYTAEVEQFDDVAFVEALAWRLAEKLALVLRAETSMAQYAREQARMAVIAAAASNQREGYAGREAGPETIRVRGGR